jgi:PilZ domain-containing protein
MANTLELKEDRAEGREQRADGKAERRAWVRASTTDHVAMARGRLRPGRTAQIVDVSCGGALIETDWRLLPGMRVELHLGEPVTLYRVKGRVLRCHVTLLDRERIRYRGALAFEEPLLFRGNERPAGSPCSQEADFPGGSPAG